MTAATTTTTSMEAEQQQPDDHHHKTEKPEEKNNKNNKNNKRKTERSSESKKAKKTKKKTKKEEKKRKRTATVKDTDDDNSDEATRDTNANTQDGKTGAHDVSKTTTRLPYGTDTNEERSNGDDDDDNEGGGGEDGGDERKIFLSRIPTKFDADSITRLFELSFGEGCVQHIALPHVRTEDEEEDGEGGGVGGRDGKSMAIDGKHAAKPKGGGDRKGDEEEEEGDHRGFAFVTMSSVDKRDEAVEKGTIRGAVKETSKKKHTMYIRSIVRNDDQDGGEGTTTKDATADLHVCYLWSKRRCPYGDTCKFNHVGEGGCVVTNQNTNGNNRKKKLKCFAFQSKGGCKIGDDCPYSHDIQNKHDKAKAAHHVVKEKKEKDCINWKSKGKCRRMDTCPYRHDNAVRDARLTKKCERPSKKQRKDNPQPLSVRVFGLNYDTKVIDVEKHFTHCGVIKEVTFPVYEDSGRSKGYCGILFTSPKATEKACELDGKELFGRWLSVQPGKMYLKQWAEMEKTRLDGRKDAKSGNDTEGTAPVQTVGEFGQKVKTRKKHGFKV